MQARRQDVRSESLPGLVTRRLNRMSQLSNSNPLLHQQFPIPFDGINAAHVQPAVAMLLAEMKERLAALAGPDVPRTYEAVLLQLDRMTEPLDYCMAVVRHLEPVATTPELRAAYNAVQEPVSAFYTSIALEPGVWAAVKAVAAGEEAKRLTGVHQRYLAKTVSGFRRAGADLDAAGKKRLEEID